MRNHVRPRLEHHAHDAQRARLLVQNEIVVQLRRRKAPVQRIGQARDIAHARGHFRDASLRRPQTRKHRAGQFAAFDGRLRRRAILFIRGQNFFRARLDGVRRGEQRLVPALARKRRQHVRGLARATDEMMNVGSFELVLHDAHLRSSKTILSRFTSTVARLLVRPPLSGACEPLPIIPCASPRE